MNHEAEKITRRSEDIVFQLRQRIVSGDWAPGMKLPTRDEMRQQFQVSNATVQRALDRLVRDEFVCVRGRRGGTHVAEYLPHLTRYAIIFPAQPSDPENWRRFWTALSNEAMGIAATESRQLPLYHDVWEKKDSETFRSIVSEVRSHRLAGLIFAINPRPFLGTPLLDEPNLPRVAIMNSLDLPGVHAVQLDQRSFIDKALDYFAARGRRKVAVLTHPAWQRNHDYFLQALASRGLQTQPYWFHSIDLRAVEGARACAHLLMVSRRAQPFDALLVTEDNLVEYAFAGLLDAEGQVPHDLDVVTHCNFPWPSTGVLPAARLGYDSRRVVRACLESIDRQRRGESGPAATPIEAVFESELAL